MYLFRAPDNSCEEFIAKKDEDVCGEKTCGECQWFHYYPNDLASKDRCDMFFFRDCANNPACDRFVAQLNAPSESEVKDD